MRLVPESEIIKRIRGTISNDEYAVVAYAVMDDCSGIVAFRITICDLSLVFINKDIYREIGYTEFYEKRDEPNTFDSLIKELQEEFEI